MKATVLGSLHAQATRVMLLVVAGALVLSGCDFSVYSLPLPGGADLGDDPISVHVKFRDVLDLVPKSSVKVDDVSVGRVDKIDVDGYTADVTVSIRGGLKLPDNAEAEIRQTSLLGEKFVSLKSPDTDSSRNLLGDGDVIPLERTGRNPEVEEVLGALSLLLNGGGVAQLKTIATELNKALDGREPDVRSLLAQLKQFMGQLDTNKSQIVQAIDKLNKLAVSLDKQKGTIKLALDELPRAVASVDRQRDDLVKMLKALTRLSTVGTRVIRASKTATVDSLQALAPTLTKLAEAGDALPNSLQALLTYPFVDAVVGTDPTQARNLHMGDYTNLSVRLDLDLNALNSLLDPTQICQNIPGLGKLCGDALQGVLNCLENPSLQNRACTGLPDRLLKDICEATGLPLCGGGSTPPVISQLDKCFRSGKPGGDACGALGPLVLRVRCATPTDKYYNSTTCKTYRKKHPGLLDGILGGGGGGGLLGGGGGGGGGLLGGVTGGQDGGQDGGQGGGLGGVLGGLGRTAPNEALAGGTGSRTGESKSTNPAYDSDLAAMLVWGMVQR